MTKVFKDSLGLKKIRCFIQAGVYPELRANDMLNENYRVLSYISEGTFGKVYKCVDSETKEKVVVKVCRLEEEYQYIYDREIYILHLIGNTSYLVNYIDDFTLNGHQCIVFELLHRSLESVLLTHFISVKDTKTILKQVLRGLEHLSSFNLIHCDIKPANIMIKTSGKLRVKIIDFGSCCKAEEVCSSFTTLCYEAPEITLGLVCSLKSDIWSVGILTIQMLTRKVLFDVDKEKDLLKLIGNDIEPIPNELFDASPYKTLYKDGDEGQSRVAQSNENTTSRENLDKLLQNLNNPSLTLFVRGCLKWKKEDRLSIKEAKRHEFIKYNYISSQRNTVQYSPKFEPETQEDGRLMKFLKFCSCANTCFCAPSKSVF